MLESIALRIEVECPECWAPIAVETIASALQCECGFEKSISGVFWTALVDADLRAEILERETDELETTRPMDGPVLRFGYGRRTPRCTHCRATIDLSAIGQHEQLACAACQHPMIVRAADELCREVDANARFVIEPAPRDRPGSPRTFYLLCEYDDTAKREAQWVDDDVRARDARADTLTLAQYTRLAADAESDVREAIAGNRAVPPDVLASLVADPEADVRAALAGNAAAPLKALATLASDKQAEVRRAVAGNPQTPLAVLERLARDADDNVRLAVVDHPTTPPALLTVFACDRHYRVRAKIAGHPAAPDEALRILARDSDSDVQRALRSNPVLTPELIEHLRSGS